MKFKAMTAIAVTALFLLTALGATVNAQTANAYTPVPYIYGQPSVHAMPYVATSNGLVYTVEPNGTYLWNGHYLRAPPVPYPKVPTIAPDGLPYGAVGPVGAQGHVGPYSFTRGTAQIKGVSPATTAGTATVINTNTYWSNESISLLGNVTVDAGDALYINNSIITFHEPLLSTQYSYGLLCNGKLVIQDSSYINQTNSTSRELFIAVGASPALSIMQNSTVNMTSVNNPKVGSNSVDTIYANHSIIEGPINNNITWAFQYGSHDIFKGGRDTIQFTTSNCSFDFTTVTVHTFYNMTYNTYSNLTVPSFTGSIHTSYTMAHNIYDNISAQAGIGTLGNLTISNDSFRNTNLSVASSSGFVIGGFFSLPDIIDVFNIEHVTFQNISLPNPAHGTTRFISIGNVNHTEFKYNKIKNVYLNGTALVGSHTLYGNVTYNLIENVRGYTAMNGYTNVNSSAGAFFNMGETAVMGTKPLLYINNNIIFNCTNNMMLQFWGRGVAVDNNTIVNVSHAQALSQGPEGNMRSYNTSVVANKFYGIYNESVGYGGNRGGQNGTTISKNVFNDVSISSYDTTTLWASENYKNQTSLVLAIGGGNGTTSDLGSIGYDKYTKVLIFNSSIVHYLLISYKTYAPPVLSVLLPYDWNITIDSSYIPSSIFSLARNFSIDYTGTWSNSTNSGFGANPSFLNLTGYLGIYQNQQYDINTSNIKGETTLPIYMNGYQVAAMSAAVGHYNLTVSTSAGTLKYAISADKTTDQPVTLYWQGQAPNAEYAVAMYDHGSLIDYTNVTSNANGVVTFQYNPATMPLDPVFQLTAFNPVITPINSMFTNSELILTIVAGFAIFVAAAIALGVGQRRSRSSRRRKR